ncbi:MAG TPA: hypothetical protein VJV75_08915, partial [Candidatus Polarisedimenticolia bacterium]|nr:hypothetical protein [Candidatus Polarisedimenticolia bacterium]
MGADPEQLDALQLDLRRVLEASSGGFTEAEIAAYRSYAAGRAQVRLAHPDQAARLWTSVLLRGGDGNSPGRDAARAATLDAETIGKAAKRMLDPRRRLTVVVGRGQPLAK